MSIQNDIGKVKGWATAHLVGAVIIALMVGVVIGAALA